MAAPKAGKNIYIKTLANDIKQGEEMVLIHYVRAYWYRNSLEDNPVWRYKVPDDANPRNSQGDRSHARGQEAAISRHVATLSLRNNKKGQPVTQVLFCIAPERVPPATAASGVKLL